MGDLADEFWTINFISRNILIVVLAACLGYTAVSTEVLAKVGHVTPFFVPVGPPDVVMPCS